MADVIDIKKRLADRVKKRLASSDEEMQEKYNRLYELISQTETVDDVLGLLEETLLLSGSVVGDAEKTLGDTNPTDAESLAKLYFGTLLGAGKLFAVTEAIKLLMDRLSELEPDILSEHYLTILDELKE